MCNVKQITCRDKPTENYSFGFWLNFTVWFRLVILISVISSNSRQLLKVGSVILEKKHC